VNRVPRTASTLPLADDVAFIVLLGALTTLPPLSVDISLPGLPAIAHALRASSAAMQQSLAVFVFAFGAAILVTLGWRSLYGVLAVAGALLVAAVYVRLPETAPGTADRGFAAYARVLRRPRTVPLALVVAFGFGAYFALISGSPFALVAQMHVASGPYAVAFALNACALLAGAFATGRLVKRVGAERLFAIGMALLLFASAVACALDVFAPSPAAFTGGFMLFAFAVGIANPSAYAAGLAGAGADAGTASAILGALQMIGGAAGSALAAALPFAPSAGIGVTVFGATLLSACAYVLSRRAAGISSGAAGSASR
jgi:DHA1 family bicyclomycin/chloramphenicol resistance-like MFS transporter